MTPQVGIMLFFTIVLFVSVGCWGKAPKVMRVTGLITAATGGVFAALSLYYSWLDVFPGTGLSCVLWGFTAAWGLAMFGFHPIKRQAGKTGGESG